MDKILKQKLIEQAKETAKLNLEICDDFKYVDGEIESRLVYDETKKEGENE